MNECLNCWEISFIRIKNGQAENGKDMYEIIKNKEPDVVLLDIFMPKMDGLTVMEKVNADKSLKKRPVFIVVQRWDRNGLRKMHSTLEPITIF